MDELTIEITRLRGEVEHAQKEIKVIQKDLYGNGEGGLKIEMARLRQALKIASWAASLVGATMILDVASRTFSTNSGDVKDEVARVDREAEARFGAVENLLEQMLEVGKARLEQRKKDN